ncbi:hypothetical protein EDD36DRAFT_420805 [Exophiala viscosa]|uniref:DUF1760-domain-containing protein n=1 Tax=Exophiala viscosa TaxID=2486360 RepID=A0AAN6DTZ3_9EURO|nr:hypothetical protein EDD36DRAFT_420805 [Exophiala viscosa]
MVDQTSTREDPLVAALPPATDYITYLTLLEYQLTPENLPTLNRLLNEDDGKLAAEIGWDLLRLILPMLNPALEEAVRCTEIVARRGNPREVVVRVAEELEKLGDPADDFEDDDLEDDDDDDALPTFAGEAPRVHLGDMTLEGMPETEQHAEANSRNTVQPPAGSSKAIKLQALLNMLGILHPRIKTQYPSRFLATSLPAALGAYRQIPITTATTSTFLTMLEKLAGKKRPDLPPRVSTSNIKPAPSSAPLPDPEAKAEEEETGVKAPSDEEKAIVHRLLSAVTLEVLDEYLSCLSSPEHSSMSWTARLRETLEPQRVNSLRVKETQLWKETEELKQQDTLLSKFHKLCTELDVHSSIEIKKVVHDEVDLEHPDQDKEEEPSEYPTSPAQIPFPRAGVIFLHAYESFLAAQDASPVLSTTQLTKLIAHSFPLSATPSIPNPALQDSLLSLLYKHALPNTKLDAPPSPAKFLLLISTLTQLFTITPWASLRDSAHHIATRLLHAHPDPNMRLQVITQTLRGSTLSTNWAETFDDPDPEPGIDEETGLTRSTSALQPHPIPLAPPQQLPALKAIGVNWLKDEFAAWTRDKFSGIEPAFLTTTDNDTNEARALLYLLFPANLQPLSSDTISTDPESDTLGSFLLDIAFYISTLNLLCIVLPHLRPLDDRVPMHITSLSESSEFLVQLLQHATSASKAAGLSAGGEDSFLDDSRADIIALQDACTRVNAALEHAGNVA